MLLLRRAAYFYFAFFSFTPSLYAFRHFLMPSRRRRFDAATLFSR